MFLFFCVVHWEGKSVGRPNLLISILNLQLVTSGYEFYAAHGLFLNRFCRTLFKDRRVLRLPYDGK